MGNKKVIISLLVLAGFFFIILGGVHLMTGSGISVAGGKTIFVAVLFMFMGLLLLVEVLLRATIKDLKEELKKETKKRTV